MTKKACHLRFVFISLFAALPSAALFTPSAFAEKPPNFSVWLSGLRTEALARGISEATLDEALRDLKPISRVVERDRKQPEFTLTLAEYLRRVVTDDRVTQGRRKVAEYSALLEQVFQSYGVTPNVLIALWGIETKYGRLTGGLPVIDATATLAFDGRRGAFFRKELLHALHILDEGHITAEAMMGSWAGAMGQFQFMPSSFRSFGVDHDGDGRIDIWNNLGDAFASAANYLARAGWVKGQRWGQEVLLTVEFDRDLIGSRVRKHHTEWKSLGLRAVTEGGLSVEPDRLSSLVQPDGAGGRAFLVYENYRAFLKWNRSQFFGIAVGILADRISAR